MPCPASSHLPLPPADALATLRAQGPQPLTSAPTPLTLVPGDPQLPFGTPEPPPPFCSAHLDPHLTPLSSLSQAILGPVSRTPQRVFGSPGHSGDHPIMHLALLSLRPCPLLGVHETAASEPPHGPAHMPPGSTSAPWRSPSQEQPCPPPAPGVLCLRPKMLTDAPDGQSWPWAKAEMPAGGTAAAPARNLPTAALGHRQGALGPERARCENPGSPPSLLYQ